jgi:hypothetical protein
MPHASAPAQEPSDHAIKNISSDAIEQKEVAGIAEQLKEDLKGSVEPEAANEAEVIVEPQDITTEVATDATPVIAMASEPAADENSLVADEIVKVQGLPEAEPNASAKNEKSDPGESSKGDDAATDKKPDDANEGITLRARPREEQTQTDPEDTIYIDKDGNLRSRDDDEQQPAA